MRRHLCFAAFLSAVLVACHAVAQVGPVTLHVPQNNGCRPLVRQVQAPLPIRIPAEFERQDGVVLGCRDLADVAAGTIADIITAVRGKMIVYLLIADEYEQKLVQDELKIRRISPRTVRFVKMLHDTMWVRDYGPIYAQHSDGSRWIIDVDYTEAGRTCDDDVPVHLAGMLKCNRLRLPIELDGGNLLTNGEGLFLVTNDLVERNKGRGYDEAKITKLLKDFLGARQVVYLEPLVGEPTAHVDMFATFTDAGTLVLGKYRKVDDEANAQVLDRNAARLAQVKTAKGGLRIVRIPMPVHDDEVWRTYTNVLYANNVLLVPVYPGFDDGGEVEALNAYAKLLPGWTIFTVDANNLIPHGGALHCISGNVPNLPVRKR